MFDPELIEKSTGVTDKEKELAVSEQTLGTDPEIKFNIGEVQCYSEETGNTRGLHMFWTNCVIRRITQQFFRLLILTYIITFLFTITNLNTNFLKNKTV